MEEILKKIVDLFDGEDNETKQKVLHMLSRNEPVDVVYTTVQDSFSLIYTAECPECGGNLKFERYSQMAAPYNYCYHCGKKLNKKIEN